MTQVFPDSKTFPDCIPVLDPGCIDSLYRIRNEKKAFDLREFVLKNFILPPQFDTTHKTIPQHSVSEHVNHLWSTLTREPDTIKNSSLIPLPNKYIVPGGRFREIYYWDSYFTMLGLKESGETEMIRNMCDNFVSLIDRYGHIPNGNRTYYLSRSQPPFFALMVELLASVDGDATYIKYFPALEKEYRFWMSGKEKATPGKPHRRVVALSSTSFLNRYWDDEALPRPESYLEDVLLAEKTTDDSTLYRNIRAAAESGWDFSSRWLKENDKLSSIHTTDILPVDLNCLLYQLELTLSKAAAISGNKAKESLYKKLAEERKRLISRIFWNQDKKFFFDYDFVRKQPKDVISAAGVYPLFFMAADTAQASAVAELVKSLLLQPGGIVTSNVRSGEQWDAPNGWPPLQFFTITGLQNYGKDQLAEEIRQRWLRINRRVFQATGRMMEKYDVMDPERKAGGGEYPTQDGFGWTNGVFLALEKQERLKQQDQHQNRKPATRPKRR